MYYFPVNLFLVFFHSCGYCIIHHGLEQQRAVVNLLAANFSHPRFLVCFSNPEDVACWDPLRGVRGSFANGSRREFLYLNMFSQVSLLIPALQLLLSKEKSLMRMMPLQLPRAFLRCDRSDPSAHAHAGTPCSLCPATFPVGGPWKDCSLSSHTLQ